MSKLEDVKSVKELADDHSVYRELCLVKVRAYRDDLQTINAIADIFRGKIDDISDDSIIIEMTGNQAKVDVLLERLKGYDIEVLELVRTGITGLARGSV